MSTGEGIFILVGAAFLVLIESELRREARQLIKEREDAKVKNGEKANENAMCAPRGQGRFLGR